MNITNLNLIRQRLLGIILINMLALVSPAAVSDEVMNKDAASGIALHGIDVISYRGLERNPWGEPSVGDKTFPVTYKGATWIFGSQESADKFKANPEGFAPAYNGYCANALSIGNGLLATSGKIWEIFGNELHLFYAPRGRKRWVNGDWKKFKIDADAAWAELKHK